MAGKAAFSIQRSRSEKRSRLSWTRQQRRRGCVFSSGLKSSLSTPTPQQICNLGSRPSISRPLRSSSHPLPTFAPRANGRRAGHLYLLFPAHPRGSEDPGLRPVHARRPLFAHHRDEPLHRKARVVRVRVRTHLADAGFQRPGRLTRDPCPRPPGRAKRAPEDKLRPGSRSEGADLARFVADTVTESGSRPSPGRRNWVRARHPSTCVHRP
jgi:hypothetical protein